MNWQLALKVIEEAALLKSEEAIRIIGFLLILSKSKEAKDFGRSWLGKAAGLGDSIAKDLIKSQVGNFHPLGPNWENQIKEFREEISNLFAVGTTPKEGQIISKKPYLVLIEDIFSSEECDYLIASSRKKLRPSGIYIDNKVVSGTKERNSSSFEFSSVFYDPVIFLLEKRIALTTKCELVTGESLIVTRYKKGQGFIPHADFFDPHSDAMKFGGQRIWTTLIYLNDCYEGGRTDFFVPKIGVEGAKGDALIFSTVQSNGDPDPTTVHASQKIQKGTKWIATKWFREKRFLASNYSAHLKN